MPGIVPKRREPRDDTDRHIVGIQYLFIERMQE